MENLTFHFTGKLADEHMMNFYEAARFQYAASRLIVKLAQFRNDGKFTQKITSKSNKNIFLATQEDGSFDIGLIMPIVQSAQEAFISVPISTLLAYVFERIFGKTNDNDIVDALNAHASVVDNIGKISEGVSGNLSKALDIIRNDQEIKESLYSENRELLERRIAELERDAELVSGRGQLSRIDGVREQKLISMAAPLVSEMATALRKSADTLEIKYSKNGEDKRRILYMNQEMAHEIELATVDKDISLLLVNIVQYNKESGWGKLRAKIGSGIISFNVPSDIKDRMQQVILSAMDEDEIYIQAYFVRDRSGEPIRLIITGLIDL